MEAARAKWRPEYCVRPGRCNTNKLDITIDDSKVHLELSNPTTVLHCATRCQKAEAKIRVQCIPSDSTPVDLHILQKRTPLLALTAIPLAARDFYPLYFIPLQSDLRESSQPKFAIPTSSTQSSLWWTRFHRRDGQGVGYGKLLETTWMLLSRVRSRKMMNRS